MLYEIKLDGVYYDIIYYVLGRKKLKEILELQFPTKKIRIITRGRI